MRITIPQNDGRSKVFQEALTELGKAYNAKIALLLKHKGKENVPPETLHLAELRVKRARFLMGVYEPLECWSIMREGTS